MRSFADLASARASDVVLVLVATGEQLLEVVESRTADRRADDEIWVICSTVGPQAGA